MTEDKCVGSLSVNLASCNHIEVHPFAESECKPHHLVWHSPSHNANTRASILAPHMNFEGESSKKGDEDSEELNSPAFLRLPDIIHYLAQEGKALCWNTLSNVYEVTDGPLFEQRFKVLRCVREKRNENAVDRPFARCCPSPPQ